VKFNGELNEQEQAFAIRTFKLMDKGAGLFIYIFAVLGVLASISLAVEFKQISALLMGLIMVIIFVGIIKLFQLYARKLIRSIEETGTTWKGLFGKGKKP
jgi:hypothetical protein